MTSRGRHIKIFISSTFQDMEAEREVLLKETFLELKKMAKERFVEITEIDLRTGITKEQEEDGKIVKICLDEIQRCSDSPIFFLGILGNRYGWDEWDKHISQDIFEDSRYSWIKRHIGKSVTELEILSAIEEEPDNNRAFFYLKEGEDDNRKLTELKYYLVEKSKVDKNISLTHYKNIKEFRDKTIDAFSKTLDEFFPPNKILSELERLRVTHDIFAQSRQKIYIAHTKNEMILSEFLESGQDKLLLYGESGYGKSALIANYFKDYTTSFVITHFIGGAGEQSNNIYQMIRRIIMEIKEEFEIIDEVPNEPQKVVEEFALWLQKVEGPTVIILDGYNQIENELKEKLFYYLPSHLKNIKLIITSITNTYPIDNCHKVEALSKDGKRKLIVNYLKKYGKTIDVITQDQIADHQQTDNALFLRILLNEVRLLGNFDNLKNDIENYLQAKNTVGLFLKVFERLEKDYNEDLVREVLSLIYVSRDGLSEDNLMDILNQERLQALSRYEFSPLFLALEEHLIDKGGLYGFFHDYMKEAVKRRYVNGSESEDDKRLKIVSYFDSRELDIQKVRELPYQLYSLENRNSLYSQLLDIEFFTVLLELDRYELLKYLRYVDERYDISMDISDKLLDDKFEDTNILNDVALFMNQEYAKYDIALMLHLSNLEQQKHNLGENHLDIATIYNNLGLLYSSMGIHEKAESFYFKALEVNMKILGENSLTTASIYNGLAVLYEYTAEYEKSELFQIKALRIEKKVLGKEHKNIANSYNNLAVLYVSMGMHKKAERLHINALKTRERLFGKKDPTIANSYNNLAVLYVSMGMYKKAKQLQLKALEIKVGVLGEKHPDTIDSYNNLGNLYTEMKAYERAEPFLLKSLKMRKSVLGEKHSKTGSSYNNLAVLYYYRKEYKKAYNYATYAIKILEKILSVDHPHLLSSKEVLDTIEKKLPTL